MTPLNTRSTGQRTAPAARGRRPRLRARAAARSRPSQGQPWHRERRAFVYVRQSSPHRSCSTRSRLKSRPGCAIWPSPGDGPRTGCSSSPAIKLTATPVSKAATTWLGFLTEVNLARAASSSASRSAGRSRAKNEVRADLPGTLCRLPHPAGRPGRHLQPEPSTTIGRCRD